MSKTTSCLVSIIHHLRDGKGHVLPYHKSLAQVSEALKIEHVFILPDETSKFFVSVSKAISFFAPHRSLELERQDMMKLVLSWRFVFLFLDTMKLGLDLRKIFKSLDKSYIDKNVFFESFNPFQLAALFVSFFMFKNKKDWHIILLLRGSDKWGNGLYWLQSKGFHRAFKLLFYVNDIFKIVPNVVLTSDSEKAAIRLREYYRKTVTVLPIPHTPDVLPEPPKKTKAHTQLWWPGHPRLDKGSEVISEFISRKDEYLAKFQLSLSKSDLVQTEAAHIQIEELSPNLDADEYSLLFSKMDVILLPYSKDVYNEATSGVFVECIFAERPALVPDETWMAYEYEKFGLPELIFDGSVDGMVESLRHAEMPSTLEKLRNMSKHYRDFHCVDGFAHEMRDVLPSLKEV